MGTTCRRTAEVLNQVDPDSSVFGHLFLTNSPLYELWKRDVSNRFTGDDIKGDKTASKKASGDLSILSDIFLIFFPSMESSLKIRRR